MAKEALKLEILKEQDGKCAISGAILPPRLSLVDTDRKTPKAKGGIYTKENTRVLNPVVHMARHGNLLIRPDELEELKAIVDDRAQVIKLKNKIASQILAYERHTDHLRADTLAWLNLQLDSAKALCKEKDKELAKFLKSIKAPIVDAARNVRGLGPVTLAYCIVYIDVEKARHASSLWKYAGLHCPSYERYQKGVAGGGNKTLRTALYTFADAQVKSRGPYREVYDRVKARLEKSEKVVKTRNTQGHLVELPWKDTKPSHRHGAAMRAIMKHFLADYWFVARTLKGLPTDPVYAEAVLGMNHRTVDPEARGWRFRDLM